MIRCRIICLLLLGIRLGDCRILFWKGRRRIARGLIIQGAPSRWYNSNWTHSRIRWAHALIPRSLFTCLNFQQLPPSLSLCSSFIFCSRCLWSVPSFQSVRRGLVFQGGILGYTFRGSRWLWLVIIRFWGAGWILEREDRAWCRTWRRSVRCRTPTHWPWCRALGYRPEYGCRFAWAWNQEWSCKSNYYQHSYNIILL